MLDEAPAPTAAGPRVLATRFGPVPVDEDRVIAFEGGLLGFACWRRYLLAEPPAGRAAGPFKLLQSVDDAGLTFLVLPLDPAQGPISEADLRAACAAIALPFEALAVLGLVTARPDLAGGRTTFTVNLRAPLLIDTARRVGRQHVFADPRYDLRHPLPLGDDRVG